MDKAVKFADGIRVFKPKEGAPDFIKLNLVISVADVCQWLRDNEDENGQVRLDLKKSTKGNFYLSLNDYKKPVEKGYTEF